MKMRKRIIQGLLLGLLLTVQSVSAENLIYENPVVYMAEDHIFQSPQEQAKFSDIYNKEETRIYEEKMEALCEAGEARLGGFRKGRIVSLASGLDGETDYRVCYSGTYGSSYGEQLGSSSKNLYDAMCSTWNNGGTGEFYWKLPEPVTFPAKDAVKNGTWEWDKAGDQAYQEAGNVVRNYLQCAYDAYIYDNPETFWLKNISYAFVTSMQEESDGSHTGYIVQVRIVPSEKWSGAKTEIGAFGAGVNAAVVEIRSKLPVNAGPGEIIKGIHDWICEKVTYGDNAYAHTANGVFLHKKEVVCEGYAKAFQILCDRFHLPAVCIAGDAALNGYTEAHMWNAVKLSGSWYLMDLTWDDQPKGISELYLLTGSLEKGKYGTVSAERKPYVRLSQSPYTMDFVTPVIEKMRYHEWKETEKIESTCKEEGKIFYRCSLCNEEKSKVLPRTDHKWRSWSLMVKADCLTEGTEKRTCSVCTQEETRMIPKSSIHGILKWTITKQATCMDEGKESGYCSICGQKREERVLPKTNQHSYGSWTITKKATCLEKGSKYRRCNICEKKETSVIPVNGNHTESFWKITEEADCQKSGSREKVCTVCGIRLQKQSISKKPHPYGFYKIIKSPTVFTAGKKERICKTCGKKDSVILDKLKPKAVITPQSLSLIKGNSKVLSVEMAAGDSIKSFTTSNSKIVSVSRKGKITGKAAGNATITVTLKSGVKAYCKVKVYLIPAKKMTISASGLSGSILKLKKGKSVTIKTVLEPVTTTDVLSYKSSDTGIFIVDGNGKITGKKAGTATLTIQAGSLKKRFTVKISV